AQAQSIPSTRSLPGNPEDSPALPHPAGPHIRQADVMAAAQAGADPRTWCRAAGANRHLSFQAPYGPGKPALPLSSGCCSPPLGGLACESERPTALPLSYCGDAAPDRFTFQSDAPTRSSFDSSAWGAPQAEPPGRWTFSSEVSTAPDATRSRCWGSPPASMGCPSNPVPCDVNLRHRRSLAPPELLGGGEEGHSDGEKDDIDAGDDGFPSKILVYPNTDDEGEGEPQMKAAWELWPVRAQRPRRGLPRPGTILGTRPREAREQAARQAAPPTPVLRRPPGIHSLAAAPAATGGTQPLGVRGVSAAAATATSTVVAEATTHREAQAQEAAGRTSRKDRRDSRPRITTLVVRNLHVRTSQQEFLDEVNRSGFAEKYDFAYIPRSFEDGSGKGNGFINFKTPEAARAFAAAWHRSRRLGMEDETGTVVPLNVSNASLQGLEANLRKWTGARVMRVKNPDFLPFVLRDVAPEPQASALEPPGSAATVATKPR
ncbi:unnamed protein product, partial [Prorocentrum cordatum]